jgi:hypothetical protein
MAMTLVAFPAEFDKDIMTRVHDGIVSGAENAVWREYFNFDKDIMTRVHDGIVSGAENAVWREYFNIETEQSQTINTTLYSGFGEAPQWYDGEDVPLDDSLKIGDIAETMLYYGMSFKVTRKHVTYGQLRIINRWADSLSKSVNATYATVHSAILTGAFTDTYTQFASKTLCSATHTTSGAGTRSNTLAVAAALTPTSVENLRVNCLNWVNYRGLPDGWNPNKLIVPPALVSIALKIAQSTNEPSTTDNDINVHRGMFQVISDQNFTASSTTAWYLQGPNHGLMSVNGMLPTPIRYEEDSSQSLVHGTQFDFVTFPEFPDGIAGTAGA